ncbi:MAG: DUF3298 and DUF4163 domain-containing protein [Bacteroidetes bacterium]|nr:DUF3298 and DUF4163 domain-containing protein [Bacteroidota bacterium]
MNNTCLLFSLSLLLLSCSQHPTLSYTDKSFTEQELGLCKDEPCSSILVEYPVFTGEEIVAKRVNERVQHYIIQSLFLGEESYASAKSIEEAATDFIMAYRDYQADLPSAIDNGGYEADITVTPYQTETLLSIETQRFLYTGGAHGYGEISYLNVDPTSGKEIETHALFKDYLGFIEEAEMAFRKENEIPSEKNINITGFWFENNQFQLPKSVGVTQDHIILVYNPYEIAPYAEGAIELKLPLEKVKAYLNSDFL